MELEAVCDELYGLKPADFTAARDTRAAEARRSGDPQLATAVKQLRRPSQAAWLANILSRQRPHRIDELLQLGDRLRDAQRRLAGEELKDLARRGHAVVAEMVADAERLATAAGQRPSPSALRQLQETLDAGLADQDAGRAVREGHLTIALSYAGLGSPTFGDGGAVDPDTSERRAAQQAQALRATSEKRIAELTAELQSAHRRRERIREQIGDLEHQLRQVRSQESDADEVITSLEAAIAEANAGIAGGGTA